MTPKEYNKECPCACHDPMSPENGSIYLGSMHPESLCPCYKEKCCKRCYGEIETEETEDKILVTTPYCKDKNCPNCHQNHKEENPDFCFGKPCNHDGKTKCALFPSPTHHQQWEEIEERFMNASWRQKLDYWTSPAGKGHTLAHIKIALYEALAQERARIESILEKLHASKDKTTRIADSVGKKDISAGPIAQARIDGYNAALKEMRTQINQV